MRLCEISNFLLMLFQAICAMVLYVEAASWQQYKSEIMNRYLWGHYKPWALYEYLEAHEDPNGFGIFYAQNSDLEKISTCQQLISKISNISCSAADMPQIPASCYVSGKQFANVLRYKSSYSVEEGLLETNYRTNNGQDYQYSVIRDSKFGVTTTIKTVKVEDSKWSTLLSIKNNSAKNTQIDMTLFFYFRLKDSLSLEDIIIENNTINIKKQFNILYLYNDSISTNQGLNTSNNVSNTNGNKTKKNNNSKSNDKTSNSSTSVNSNCTQDTLSIIDTDFKNPQIYIFEDEVEDKHKLLFYTKPEQKNSETQSSQTQDQNQNRSFNSSANQTKNQSETEEPKKIGVNEENSCEKTSSKRANTGKLALVQLNIRNLRPLFHISFDQHYGPPASESQVLQLMKKKELEFQQNCSRIFFVNQTGPENSKQKFQIQQIFSNLISSVAILKLQSYQRTAGEAAAEMSGQTSADNDQRGAKKKTNQIIITILDKKYTHSGTHNGFQRQSLQEPGRKQKKQNNPQEPQMDDYQRQFLEDKLLDQNQQPMFSLYNLGFSLLSIAKWDVEFAMLIMDSIYNSRDALGKFSFSNSQDIFEDPLQLNQPEEDQIAPPTLLFALEKIQNILMKKYNNTIALFPQHYREFFQQVAIPLFDGWLHEMVFATSLSKGTRGTVSSSVPPQNQQQQKTKKKGPFDHSEHSPQQMKKMQAFNELHWDCGKSQQQKCTVYPTSGFTDMERHDLDSVPQINVDYISWTIFLSDYMKMMSDLHLAQRRQSMQYDELSSILKDLMMTSLIDKNATMRDLLHSIASGSEAYLSPGISYVNLVPFVLYLFFDKQNIFQQYGMIFSSLSSKFGIASAIKMDKSYDIKSGLYSYRGGVSPTFNFLMLKALHYVSRLEVKFSPFYINLRSKLMNTMIFNYERNEKLYESYHPEEPAGIREGSNTPVHSVFILIITEDY